MIVDLGGDGWSIREALGDTWQWFVDKAVVARNNTGSAADAAQRTPGWLPARVPGAIIADLHRAGELSDPYVGRNSRHAEWVATRSWVYRRDVDLPPLGVGERAVLCLDGIDPAASVYVDGRFAGRVDGLYHSARIDVTGYVSDGGPHRLAIVVEPAPPSEPQVGRTERVQVHAPRLGHGWDFCPRLIHQGIWRGVRLDVGRCQLAGVTVRPELDSDLRSARVHLAADVEVPSGTEATLEVVLRAGVEVIAAAHVPAGPPEPSTERTDVHRVEHVMEVAEPRLWWPRGLGEQHRYTVQVRAVTNDGASTPWSGAVGFRHVTWVANHGAPPGALPYTAIVNGRRTELIGWNWAPADALYGEIDARKVAHLVDVAARSGARLLRVWGGGLVETPEFYDACDRAGLFVWQEFSQSSSGMQSAPADSAQFIEHLRAEARAVIPPRLRHPSLLLWGGGNELEDDDGPLDDDRSPALAALHEQVAALDPGRAWLPTSPTGPRFANRLDVIDTDPDGMHDVHGPWEHQGTEEHYTLYNRGQALAHTEFGVEGMANRRLWSRLIPVADRWPVGRDNPVYRHLGDWWNNAELVQQVFGGRLDDPDAFRRASQLLQATGLTYAVEADRRRWPRCSITLPWQLAESYPNAWCTAVVDHAGEAKPALHAVRRSYRPERVTARVDRLTHPGGVVAVEPWLWSEPGRPRGGRVEARLLDEAGRCVAHESWQIDDPVGRPRSVGRFEVKPSAVGDAATPIMFWDLHWQDAAGELVDRETVLLSTGHDLAPLLDLAPAELVFHVERSSDDRRWTVTVDHVAGPVVVGLQLSDDRPLESSGWFVVDADPRPLLPGHQRRFTVEWRHDTGPRRLLLEAWNVPPATLTDDAEESTR